jgi:hypothetical protein
MTEEQKKLVFELLRGDCYLRPKKKPDGTDAFMIYQGNQVPVKYYSQKTVNKFKRLFKKDKIGRLTFNLKLVRKLHGKNHVKKTYKLLKTKNYIPWQST